ncbi:hypothetical protein M3Y99_01832600 [Aphelenchoides fujianensis]|nr:hypothetical protein M3Y99_01832600 [Aphelenchoides fujianensis]
MLNSAGRLAAKPRDVWPLVAAKRNLRRQPPPPGKPPIVPPSKKVLYTAVHREWTEPAHVEELLWRRHVYTNAMQSIRKERSANFVTAENLDQKLNEALEKPPTVFDFAIDVQGTKFVDPTPLKYQTGMPTRQKGRLYDRTLAHSGQQRVIPAQPSEDAPPAAAETPAN